MRRLALLLLAAFLLYSCASTGDDAVEDLAVPSEEVTAATPPTDEPAEKVPAEEVQPGLIDGDAEEAEPPADAPLLLTLLEPEDPAVLTARELTVRGGLEGGAVGGTELQSLEFELLSGPFVTGGFEIVDASAATVEERTARLAVRDGAAAVSLPAGLVDGERYTWRARGVRSDGTVTEWTPDWTTLLDLDLSGPQVAPADPTIDTTPTIRWESDDLHRAYRVNVTLISGEELAAGITRVPSYTLPEVTPGRYRVTVRALRTDGFATRMGPPSTVRVLDDASPRPVWPAGGEPTISTTVGLHWSPVAGAASYEARYRPLGADEWVSVPSTSEPFVPVPVALPQGQEFEWQVRARNEAGRIFSWSDAATFTVDDLRIEFATVIEAGGQASFRRGYESGSRDETPVRDITLTRPFEMTVHPLTNAQVARIVNYALDRGLASADAAGVYLTPERIVPLIGLAEMDYGQQLGLAYRDGSVVVERGYENHPAVGITWHGAIQIASFFSFAEGRTPAYDGTGSEWNRGADGYRLPTEAEWEYAARGDTSRLYPWGSDLSGRVANYYRSFDPYEDVNEPFTGSGGPTTPVGFFSGRAVAGFQTVNDASPFGIRDLLGNVWEWCWDRYDPEYYASSPDINPDGPEKSNFRTGEAVVLAVSLDPNQRVVRGTAWNSRAPDVRLTNRGRYTELGRSYSIGVRLVRQPLP